MKSDLVSVVLPCYNEKGNLNKLIEEIQVNLKKTTLNFEVIVVDDNSPDGTGPDTIEHFKNDKTVKVFIRKNARGFATAIRYGVEKSEGDIIIIMDSDFNHDPRKLPQMVDMLKYYDIISGSRYVMGGGMPSLFRYLSSFVYNFFVRLIIRSQLQDNLCGYISIRRDKLFCLPFKRIFYGYGDYFFRLIFFAQRKRMRMLEIPVFYRERLAGKSKSNLLKVLIQYTSALLRLRIFHR